MAIADIIIRSYGDSKEDGRGHMNWSDNLGRLIGNFFSAGIRDTHNLEDRLRIRVINIISFITIIVLLFFGTIALRNGAVALGLSDLSVAVIFFSTHVYLRRTGAYSFIRYLWIGSTGVLFVYLFNTGGIDQTGHLWAYIFPVVAAFLLGSRQGAIAISAVVVSIVVLWMIDFSQGRTVYSVNLLIRFVISYAIISYSVCYYERFRQETLRMLEESNLELDTQIAKLKEAEEALKKNQEELERRVEDRTNELKEANEELQREIVEHSKTEERLRSSEEQYRLLFENSFDPIFSIDRQFNCVSMSPSIERILGYKPEELIGRPIFELNLLPDNYMNLAFAQIMQVFAGESISGSAYEVLAKDGTVKVAQISGAPIRKHGEVVGMISISRDITAQKKTEEELRRAHDELEMRVSLRTEELKRANEALETANRAKSDFLANMSHELRTPLNHIIGFTELVADKQCGELNEVQEEYLRDVLQSSGHLLSLIDDILDLSKVEAGKLEVNAAEISLPALLENGVGMFEAQAIKRGIRILTDRDGSIETIRADDRKIKQIIYNLLSNAVKFTADGGLVTISTRYLSPGDARWSQLQREAGEFPLDGDDPFLKRDPLIEVSVADTGIGIEEAHLQRIFDPFEQVDNSLSRRYHGTGLGLALTRRLVELHGGRIWAVSEGIGKGSTFIFVLSAIQTCTVSDNHSSSPGYT
jgi:PAS domain S-box-containing protein